MGQFVQAQYREGNDTVTMYSTVSMGLQGGENS